MAAAWHMSSSIDSSEALTVNIAEFTGSGVAHEASPQNADARASSDGTDARLQREHFGLRHELYDDLILTKRDAVGRYSDGHGAFASAETRAARTVNLALGRLLNRRPREKEHARSLCNGKGRASSILYNSGSGNAAARVGCTLTSTSSVKYVNGTAGEKASAEASAATLTDVCSGLRREGASHSTASTPTRSTRFPWHDVPPKFTGRVRRRREAGAVNYDLRAS